MEDDRLAVEEPLEIRIGGRAVAVTMRTPGHDEELALGFCLTEGLRPTEARPPDDLAANVIDVDAPGADLDRVQRSFYTSSSCGVCGKGALEAVAVEAPRIESRVTVPFDVVAGRPHRHRHRVPVDADLERLLDRQAVDLLDRGGQPSHGQPPRCVRRRLRVGVVGRAFHPRVQY